MAINQIKKKFIGNDQVDGQKILLGSSQTLRKEDGLGGEIDVLADIEGQIAAEEARALAAEGALASDIADVNTRVDNVLSNVDGTALNSLAEIVTAFQQADSDLNGAITLLASDLDTRIDGVDATVAAIDVRLTTAEGGLAQEILDRIADVDAEETRALAAEAVLNGYIDGLGFSITAIEANIIAIDDAKVNRAGDTMTGPLIIQDSGNPSNNTSFSYNTTQVTFDDGAGVVYYASHGVDVILEKDDSNNTIYHHAEIAADGISLYNDDGNGGPQSAFIPTIDFHVVTKKHLDNELASLSSGGIASLQSELDSTQVGAGLETSGSYVAPVGSNYLGSAVSLKDADSKLDAQIKVVADDLAQEILDRAADVDAEESRAIAAEGLLDGRLDVLEAVTWYKEKFVVNSTILSNGFVTLAHSPKANSMSAFVDRLAIHEGATEDYSISGAVMTFLNDLVSPGNQSLAVGDIIFVKYQA